MLKRGGSENRLLNLAASLELSISKGPRMTDPARRLLSLLGVLPDGIARGDLETLLPGFGNAAAGILRQVALAFDEAGRLRALAPVREHVAAHHPPAPEDLARAIDHYSGLAKELGPKCGARRRRRSRCPAVRRDRQHREHVAVGAEERPSRGRSSKPRSPSPNSSASSGLGTAGTPHRRGRGSEVDRRSRSRPTPHFSLRCPRFAPLGPRGARGATRRRRRCTAASATSGARPTVYSA